MKNSTIAIIIVITLIIVMLASGIIYAFSTSAPQRAEEPKADVTDESNTEAESVTDTVTDSESTDIPETTSSASLTNPVIKVDIQNGISDEIPGITEEDQRLYGLIKSGVISEMSEKVKNSGMKVEDIQNDFSVFDMQSILGLFNYGEEVGSIRISSLQALNLIYPVEFLKLIDEDHLYVVYKTIGRNNQIWYSYLFFERIAERCNETHESWWRRGNVFYVAKALEYSDFADIHIGSTTADVHAVDPVVGPAKNPEGFTEPFKSYHLMKDGVLTLTFSFDPETKWHRVSEMKYDDSFTFGTGDRTMNVRIDPNDLPASDAEMK